MRLCWGVRRGDGGRAHSRCYEARGREKKRKSEESRAKKVTYFTLTNRHSSPLTLILKG